MKTTDFDPRASDDRFDHAMHARYAEATANVSARTRAQLHNRLRGTLATPARSHSHRPAWGLAAVCSLVLVTAIGLQLRAPREPTPAPVLAVSANDNDDLLASLDEGPDLYLWLASDDASSLVSE